MNAASAVPSRSSFMREPYERSVLSSRRFAFPRRTFACTVRFLAPLRI
jgi:hypothetical protein